MFEVYLIVDDCSDEILYATTSLTDAEEILLTISDEDLYMEFLWDLFYDDFPAIATNYTLDTHPWRYIITKLSVMEDN